jgi:AraC-like DNA-binding protein
MRAGSQLAVGDGFDVNAVRCAGARLGFDAPEETTGHGLVFVRRGAFVRQVAGREVLLDSTVAYLTAPGEEQRCAHPVGAGDTCVVIGLSPGLAASLGGGEPGGLPAVPMDAASEFAIRRVASLARGGDIDGELAEQVAGLVAALVARGRPGGSAGGGPGNRGDAARERLAGQAREILLAEPNLGVVELARRVSCSPHYLSRVFSRVTGSGISAYRNRIRVSRALERIGQGERDLAALAHELGFADHAHLTRTVRAVMGHTPTACRALLQLPVL